MAVKGQEVEGIQGGIQAASTVKGSFNQNMLFRRSSVETREGFGQVAELDTTMNAITWRAYSGSNIPTITPDPTQLWGYKEHLGSYLMSTSMGNKQVISVFSADVHTGDRQLEPLANGSTGSSPSAIGEFASIYIVSIYDLDTGQRWEEPLYNHTASFSKDGALEMPDWHGNYESAFEQKYGYDTNFPGRFFGGVFNILADQQKWIRAPSPGTPFFFTELDDVLYFGNKHVGLMAYYPSKFRSKWAGDGLTNSAGTMRRTRSRQADTVYFLTAKPIYSESSVVVDAIAVNGAFPDGFEYLNQTEFPSPDGATSIDGRLVMFSGNNVFFSDVLYPTSVIPDNVLFVPSEETITAIAEHTGNLLIYTQNETWLFRPSGGFVITQGSLIKLSSGVGCASHNAVVGAGAGLYWMDHRGCYRIASGLSIERVSDPIEPFFNDFITNPITSYYTMMGKVPTQATMPDQSSLRLAFDPRSISTAYFGKMGIIAFCLPSLGGALCLSNNAEWSWWSFESNVLQVYDPSSARWINTIGAAKNIRNPWAMADMEDMFLVGSYGHDESGERVNQGGYGPEPRDDRQTISRPYCILKYGRGGSVDRSVEFGEDRRALAGNWRGVDEGNQATLTPALSDHYYYVGKPIPIPAGTTIGDAGGSVSTACPKGSFWLPIEIVPGNTNSSGNVTHYYLGKLEFRFTFDSTKWETIPAGAGNTTAEPLWFLPPERMRGEDAWGVVKSAADNVQILFQGSASASNLKLFGYGIINANKRQRNRLIYIPFRPIQSGGQYKAFQGIGMNITVKNVNALTGESSGSPVYDGDVACRAYIWEETFLGKAEKGDNKQAVYAGTSDTPVETLVAQPVDWAYKTRPVSDPDKIQIKGRGLRIIGTSRGAATHRLTSGWPTGILNTVSGADYKEWSSQVVDIIPSDNAVNSNAETPAVVLSANKTTVRNRIKDSSTGDLAPTTFNTTNGPQWSSGTATPPGSTTAAYRYITDEEEVSLLNISDGVRGQSVSYMLWGHIQNKAEKIILHSAKVVIRVLGGVRRKGR